MRNRRYHFLIELFEVLIQAEPDQLVLNLHKLRNFTFLCVKTIYPSSDDRDFFL